MPLEDACVYELELGWSVCFYMHDIDMLTCTLHTFQIGMLVYIIHLREMSRFMCI